MNDKFVAAITPELMTDIERLSLRGRDYGIRFEVMPSRFHSNLRDLVVWNPKGQIYMRKNFYLPAAINMHIELIYAFLDNLPDSELWVIEHRYMGVNRESDFSAFRKIILEWYG